jgi:O-antigen/teichoic acid export membrane protein
MLVQKHHIINGGFLLGSVVLSNFLNFLFNALLGRWLSFENFGLITLVVTFYYLSSIFTNTLASTINFQVSKFHNTDIHGFFMKTMRKVLWIATIFCGVWILLTPILMNFFHLTSVLPLLSFAVIVMGSTFVYSANGYLQGKLKFAQAGALTITEPIVKLITGVMLAVLGFGAVAYFSLPLSLIATAALAAVFVLRQQSKGKVRHELEALKFPRHFFITSFAAGIGTAAFFSVDVLLVRHFFSPSFTGQYAIVSLIGKMMYFFCVLPNMFTIPIVARTQNVMKLRQLFFILLGATATLVAFGWVALGFLGHFLVPLLFGAKVLPILPLLPTYLFGIGLFALSSVMVSFHLAKQEFTFSYALIAATLFVSCLILVRHTTLSDITSDIAISSVSLAAVVATAHIASERRSPAYGS